MGRAQVLLCSFCGPSEKVSDAMPTVDGAALPRILLAGRAVGLPPPPHRHLTASAKAVIASACGVTTLGDPARVPHCKESWPFSGHRRTHIGKTKLRPAVKQGEHAPFH